MKSWYDAIKAAPLLGITAFRLLVQVFCRKEHHLLWQRRPNQAAFFSTSPALLIIFLYLLSSLIK
jgi:hypothetical protein